MERNSKLNPLIYEQIKNLPISENKKAFLENILYIELKLFQNKEDRFRSDYENAVDRYFL
jgi:hypothetical protein